MATHAAARVSMTALSPPSHAQIIGLYSYHRLVQIFLDPEEGHRVSHSQDILESNYCKHWEQSGVWFPKCPLHTVNKTTEHDRVHHQHAVWMKADVPKLHYVPIFCMPDWTVSCLTPGPKRHTGADRVSCVEAISEKSSHSTFIWSVS